MGERSKVAAGLIAIFLGGFGIHKFYLGKVGQGILYLIFFWTGIPFLVGFIEGIVYLAMNERGFQQKYGAAQPVGRGTSGGPVGQSTTFTPAQAAGPANTRSVESTETAITEPLTAGEGTYAYFKEEMDAHNPRSVEGAVEAYLDLQGWEFYEHLDWLETYAEEQGLLAGETAGELLPMRVLDRILDRLRRHQCRHLVENFFLHHNRQEGGIGTWVGEGIPSYNPRRFDNEFKADLSRLTKLLQSKGASFDSERDVYFIVGHAGRRLYQEYFQETIEQEDPKSLDSYVESFVRQYGEDWKDQFEMFVWLVEDREFDIERSELRDLAEDTYEQLDLQRFEQRLAGETGGTASTSDLDAMTGPQFEEHLARLFRGKGYEVERTPATGDQGADLLLDRNGERIVVEAKRYSGPVGNRAVQAVAAAKAHYDADKAMVITNSTFTQAARTLAASNEVELVDRDGLASL